VDVFAAGACGIEPAWHRLIGVNGVALSLLCCCRNGVLLLGGGLY